MADDPLIERIATAWLRHQGYTDNVIGPLIWAKVSHQSYGCEPDGAGVYTDCTDENGDPLHPIWDAICEASEMANVVVETLGLTPQWAPIVVDDDGHTWPRWNEWYDDAHQAVLAVRSEPGTVLGTAWVTDWEPTDGS